MRTYTYEDAIKLLTSSGKFRICLGLERIENILKLLGNPQDKLNYIHVAGTNGKGSVCTILASILNESKRKVGLYTSPHIFKYTERIKISVSDKSNNDTKLEPINDYDFAKYVYEILELAQENNIDLTEFEILTAVMFKYFADNNVDIVVLETGLGGRFDATNVIKKNMCSVITHIDYDHTERLGNTLAKIAYEKAGIMKPNCPCIVLEGYEAFYDYAMEIGAQLEIISPVQNELCKNLTLKGTYQRENLSLALGVIEKCFPDISSETIKKGLEKVIHPFRFQYIKDKNLIIDGAHNPNGINLLIENIKIYYPNMKYRFIFGCLNNKDYKKMIKEISEIADSIYIYHFNHNNSCTFEQLKSVIQNENCYELTKYNQIDLNDGYLNIICGSFYMISELTELLNIRYYFQ